MPSSFENSERNSNFSNEILQSEKQHNLKKSDRMSFSVDFLKNQFDSFWTNKDLVINNKNRNNENVFNRLFNDSRKIRNKNEYHRIISSQEELKNTTFKPRMMSQRVSQSKLKQDNKENQKNHIKVINILSEKKSNNVLKPKPKTIKNKVKNTRNVRLISYWLKS